MIFEASLLLYLSCLSFSKFLHKPFSYLLFSLNNDKIVRIIVRRLAVTILISYGNPIESHLKSLKVSRYPEFGSNSSQIFFFGIQLCLMLALGYGA